MSTTTPAPAPTRPRPLVLSLKPRFAEALLDGSKTVELRKTRVNAPPGTKLIFYASSPTMAVVGTATLAAVDTDTPNRIWQRYRRGLGLTRQEFLTYLAASGTATALSVTDPRRLATAPTLTTLRQQSGFRPPQSYRYLSEIDPPELHSAACQ